MKKILFNSRKNFLSCCFFFLSLTFLSASTITFTNGGGDNLWSNPSNWNAFSVPGTNDDVIVSSGSLTVDVKMDVKSLTISSTAIVNVTHNGNATVGDLNISGGSFTSSGKLNISSGLNWSGSSSLTSSKTITLDASASSTFSGTGNLSLYATLVNDGTVYHSGGSLRFQTGGSFENNGTYTVDGATFIINTGGDGFYNKGIFNKNNTNELNFFAEIDQPGGGTLNVNAGTLKFLSGGDVYGTSDINIASGAKMSISSGAYLFGPATSINGAGDLEILGGTFSIESTFNLTGSMQVGGGTVDFNTGAVMTFEDVTLSGGTIQGSSQLVVNDNLSWSGSGTIKGTGSIQIASTGTGSIYGSSAKKLYIPLINDGSISHSAGQLRMYSGSSIENNGTYTTSSSASVNDNGGGAFENNGVFNNQNTSSLNVYPDFNNNLNGTVKGKGTLAFSNLTNLGIFDLDSANGTLNLSGTFDNGQSLMLDFDNATHSDLAVSGDISLSGSLDVTSVGTVPVGMYKILSTTSGVITGAFDTENIGSNFSIVYTATEVNLSVGLLPVELVNFNASPQGSSIVLEWQTALELNSEKFIVEHSSDGQNFTPIGEVQAAGTSNTIIDYGFFHESPMNGINYYRLRQVDLDGSFEYSDFRVINFYYFDKEITVYPNPTMGRITIKNQSEKEFKVTIRNLSGKIVYVLNGMGAGATSLDLQDLPKSMYTLEFSDGVLTHTEKVMILE